MASHLWHRSSNGWSRQRIGYAALTGLGAVSSATVSYWNAQTKQYEQHQLAEQMEVVSLVGNVTIREGKTRYSCACFASVAAIFPSLADM